MQTTLTNYAFIDSQNLNLGVKSLGWKLDFVKFRRYLKTCSSLLKKSAKESIIFMDNLRKKLEYNEKAPPEDKTSRGAISCEFIKV